VVEISEFHDSTGRSFFSRWFHTLDGTACARVTEALDRLALGNFSAIKSVGRGVHELRINFGPGYRVYCGRDGETLVILLGGGTKKRQQQDIETAQSLWGQYKKRKRETI
jgi:putative addiction module killer protein